MRGYRYFFIGVNSITNDYSTYGPANGMGVFERIVCAVRYTTRSNLNFMGRQIESEKWLGGNYVIEVL